GGGCGGAPVAADGESLLFAARDLPFAGDVLGGLAHADVSGGHGLHQRRVDQRIVAVHRHAAHALDAGANEDLTRAKRDLAGGDVDRLHGRSAEPVDGDTGDRQRQISQQANQTGDVEALLALGKGAADDYVLDVLRVDAAAA